MKNIDLILLILLLVAGLGILNQNVSVALAGFILVIIRIVSSSSLFALIEKYSVSLGVLVLTVGAMSPIASGKISIQDIFNSFLKWQSILAVVIGILVSWLGSRGVLLISCEPYVISGLLVGTIIGVSFFHGVSVGPLIAAGTLSLFINKS